MSWPDRNPLALVLLLVLLVVAGCGAQEPPNVLVICIDTLRADHLGCHGDARGLTPAVDALAARGTRFTQAIAPAPFTAPSVATMTTGVSPLVHGVRSWRDFGRRYRGTSLADAFRAAGYRTTFLGANGFLAPIRPIRRGFAAFEDVRDRPGPDLTKAVLEWIRSAGGEKPWFVWAHYFDPHAPYVDHPEHGEKFLTPPDRAVHRKGDFATASPAREDWPQVTRIFEGLYAGEVAYADGAVGTLLDELRTDGVLDRTHVVVTADHGENLADHAPYFSHNDALFDSLLHVPLIFAGPDIEEGREVDALVSLADLGRTLFDLAGIEAPSGYGGRSLAPALSGEEIRAADSVAADAGLQKVRLLALRSDREKVLLGGEGARVGWLRFDLAADPGETRPLPVEPTHPLVRRLTSWLSEQRLLHESWNNPPDGTVDERTPEEIEQLKAFGYLR
ncbi:MAG: sulfatase [Planctomycetota bacterium]|jgi:arylsulfatase A-like enzyme